jgi:quercetin dioxygenase-like cupin family protein
MSRANRLALALAISAALLPPAGAAGAEPPTVTPLLAKELAGSPGKEVVVITVEYSPDGAEPIHRHHAQAFVYVL